ncbi:MAG TPA: alcohol dehydrogenase catalytic domain-containing protein [Thermoleophilaceae bacterium]|nr:alcohol dehydrogenase catalytic domain-containing protein [Thermoleophilaceae bacterium]
MRAAVVEAAAQAAVTELEPPEPGPEEVLVRLEGCGVCGSDVPLFEGRPWFEYPAEPGAPGHEGWGIVEKVGRAVTRPKAGTRVAALSYRAYAELDLAAADQVTPLPAAVDGIPFPGEALGCAVNVFRRSGVQAGQRVGVVGVGFLGALLVQLAARAGAEVVAVSRRPSALDVARRFGAADVMRLGEQDLEDCDRVIEAAGKQETIDAAARMTRTRGRLVIAGFHQDGPRTVDMQLWNWRGLDVVNAHERDPRVYVDAIREAARMVAEGELDPRPLFTHVFPLERIGEALASVSKRPDGFMKALVVP